MKKYLASVAHLYCLKVTGVHHDLDKKHVILDVMVVWVIQNCMCHKKGAATCHVHLRIQWATETCAAWVREKLVFQVSFLG